MDLLTALVTPPVTPLPGSAAVLAAHGPALPQPDQLCGPFSVWVALHAVLATPPPVVALALAAGTRIWPHDVAAWRPHGAPQRTQEWTGLPRAGSAEASGTDAAGVSRAVSALTDLTVVPAVGGGVEALLAGLVELGLPVGVVANVRTGPISPDPTFDVGHFVVLLGHAPGRVLLGDTYVELGAQGCPPGCRVVDAAALDVALTAAPGRGVLLLARSGEAPDVRAVVGAAGMSGALWST